MVIKSESPVWVCDAGRWLPAVVIEIDDRSALVRFENGVSVAVSQADIRSRDPSFYETDKPPPSRPKSGLCS